MQASQITALLGPTNTGKTHRAIVKMLDYQSGMIGLPLRLLAREVYDRVSGIVGQDLVALITGEEKRVPRRARYWICTVEAMPLDREVEFLAIDEIQLAAHAQRGHVFTDRMLRARGTKETWFLGAATMSDAIAELVPTAQRVEHPRLSRLRFAGVSSVSRLPARTAVVAFSMPQVYELAEKLRVHRGGAAVVLGALSPRARNAQVAMFEAGEVDYLVATDAIGMGLNLNVHHVAFAGLRKFDGHEVRELEGQEIAQIAGRAGRWIQDGTFGALAPTAFPQELAHDIETHHFPSVRKLVWRNSDLDFASLDALRASLRVPPRTRWLRPVQNAEDAEVLERFSARPDLRAAANSPERVRLLWDVATVPDFRRLLFESHVAFLADVFLELTGPRAQLANTWIAPRVSELDDVDGDVDTLVSRMSAIRTWTYIAHQSEWAQDAEHWQVRTREIEERLSDALHERLVSRFVDVRAKRRALPAKPHAPNAPREPMHIEVDRNHPFAALASMRDRLLPSVPEAPPQNEDWVSAVVQAEHETFSLDERGRISFGSLNIARLVHGNRVTTPDVKLLDESLGAGARSQVQKRMLAHARDIVNELLEPVTALGFDASTPEGRALLHQLEMGLGAAPVLPFSAVFHRLSAQAQALAKEQGLVLGVRWAFVRGMGALPKRGVRRVLVSAYMDRRLDDAVAQTAPFDPRGLPDDMLLALGAGRIGKFAVSVDLVEDALREVLTEPDLVERAHRFAHRIGLQRKDVVAFLSGTRY